MTGTLTIVTIYNNMTGAECTALMNNDELAKMKEFGEDVTICMKKAETVTAAEVQELLRLRCPKE